MQQRENETRSNSLKFNGHELELVVKTLDKLQTTIDVIYYLMEHENEQSFVLMLVTANDVDLNTLLDKQKRDTDILFEINKEEPLYMMLCQDTKVDGGYHFAERVINNIQSENGNDVYCTVVEVKSTHYSPKQVILKLLETFIKSKQLEKSGEIIFRSLN